MAERPNSRDSVNFRSYRLGKWGEGSDKGISTQHLRPNLHPIYHESSTTEAVHTHTSKSTLYPAFLILEGKLCAVVGGGRVATRKVHSLLAVGAHVVVISPALHVDLQTLLAKGLIDHIPHNYAAEHLTGANLVFAATNNSEVNRQVAHDARSLHLLVNVADDPDISDFHVPATISRQDLTLAIATSGGSPAFARYVRELVEQALGDLGRED